MLLEIENLYAAVVSGANQTPILRGLSLKIAKGSIHAIMGPNGAGKSTLSKIIAGHPDYIVTGGDIRFNGVSILEMEPEERALAGIFMGFQYPLEIPGITNAQFLHAACNARMKGAGKKDLTPEEFSALLDEKSKLLEMKNDFKERGLNEGFSGGEKKRNEILQMALFDPKLAILDETDSGLDIDAMRVVARGISALRTSENALLLITHYQRLLELIKPDFVHVMVDGRIVKSGGSELSLALEASGYAEFGEVQT